MNKGLISIIVPVYNVEEYLDRCVESLVNQTYTNLEIILVDDGSPDNSGKLCDEWALKDKRVKVIHKENGGVSSARNIGIDNANGEYIGFVDSDDYVDINFLSTINALINKEKKDVYVFNYFKVKDGNIVKNTMKCDNEKYSLEVIKANGIDGFVCNKIYKKSIICDIRFNLKVSMCEDLLFNLELSKKNIDYGFLNIPLYYYFDNNSSATNKKYKTDISRMDVVEYMIDNSSLFNEKISCDCKFSYIIEFYDIYLYNKKYLSKEIDLKNYRGNVKKYISSGILFSKHNIIDKLKVIMIYCFPMLYKVLKYKRIRIGER